LYNLIYECESMEEVVDGKEFTDIDLLGTSIMGSEHTSYVHEVSVGYGVLYINQDPADPF